MDEWTITPFVLWRSIPFEGWHPEGFETREAAYDAGLVYTRRTGQIFVVTGPVLDPLEAA